MTTASSTSQSVFTTAPRYEHLVVGADHGVGGLHEHDGLRRHLRAGLVRVVAVVQPDADDLAGRATGAADSQPLGRDHGQRITLERVADARHSPGSEESPIDLGLSDVAQVTGAVHHHRTLLADRSYSQQLHTASLSYTSDVSSMMLVGLGRACQAFTRDTSDP